MKKKVIGIFIFSIAFGCYMFFISSTQQISSAGESAPKESLVILDTSSVQEGMDKIRFELDLGISDDIMDGISKGELALKWQITGLELTGSGEFSTEPKIVSTKESSEMKSFASDSTEVLVSYVSFHDSEEINLEELPEGRYDVQYKAEIVSLVDKAERVLLSAVPDVRRIAVIHSNSDDREESAKSNIISSMTSIKSNLTVDENSDFAISRVDSDNVGYTHILLDQYYKGIKLHNGQLMVHLDDLSNSITSVTSSVKKDISMDVVPKISELEALTIADKDISPKGPYSEPQTSELVIVEDDGGNHRLAYHVQSKLDSESEFSQMQHFIDAVNGEIIKKWDDVRGAAAAGTGKTLYYGQVPLNTNSIATGFELKDMTRAANPRNRVLAGTTSENDLYRDDDNIWGDGQNFVLSNPFMSENGETSAADVAFGVQKSYDYFDSVLGNRGQDDHNSPVRATVHANISLPAQGSLGHIKFKNNPTPATTLDIVGHEYTHGVSQVVVNFDYVGETAGLDEGTSDIYGAMIEFFAKPNIADWIMCAQVSSVACLHQRFDKPSRAGDGSADFWSANVGNLESHRSSGVLRYFFYYLVNGVPTSGVLASPYLPGGNAPIGSSFGVSKRRAAEIWYQAIRFRMFSNTNYDGARIATAYAATDLGYNASTVRLAWKAVNVNRPERAIPRCEGDDCIPTP